MQQGGWGKKEGILWEEEKGLSSSLWQEYGSFAPKCLISPGTQTKPSRNVGRAIQSVTLANAPERFQNHREQI